MLLFISLHIYNGEKEHVPKIEEKNVYQKKKIVESVGHNRANVRRNTYVTWNGHLICSINLLCGYPGHMMKGYVRVLFSSYFVSSLCKLFLWVETKLIKHFIRGFCPILSEFFYYTWDFYFVKKSKYFHGTVFR